MGKRKANKNPKFCNSRALLCQMILVCFNYPLASGKVWKNRGWTASASTPGPKWTRQVPKLMLKLFPEKRCFAFAQSFEFSHASLGGRKVECETCFRSRAECAWRNCYSSPERPPLCGGQSWADRPGHGNSDIATKPGAHHGSCSLQRDPAKKYWIQFGKPFRAQVHMETCNLPDHSGELLHEQCSGSVLWGAGAQR